MHAPMSLSSVNEEGFELVVSRRSWPAGLAHPRTVWLTLPAGPVGRGQCPTTWASGCRCCRPGLSASSGGAILSKPPLGASSQTSQTHYSPRLARTNGGFLCNFASRNLAFQDHPPAASG